jgi:uncharacterized coiled-coil protein SlyX
MLEQSDLQQIKELIQAETNGLKLLIHEEINPLKLETQKFWDFMVEMKEQITNLQRNILQIEIRLAEYGKEIENLNMNVGELISNVDHVIARLRRVEEEVKGLRQELSQVKRMFTEDNIVQMKDVEELKDKMLVLENEIQLLKNTTRLV